jgi:hypothetical protein
MRYAMSDSPLGPWKDMGPYMYPTGTETNHGSLVEFKGKWYSFYHTSNYSGHGALRSVCVDPITMRPDGTYEVVRNWGTPNGGGAAPELRAGAPLKLEAEKFNDGGYHYGWFKRSSRNDKVSVTSGGGKSWVEKLETGDWVRYTFTAASAGKYTVECVVSANRNDSRFQLNVNGSRPESEGVKMASSGGNWETVTVKDMEVSAGENYLEFRVASGSFNADSFVIKK